MDISERYVRMCQGAVEIQEEFFKPGFKKYFPSFVYDRDLERISIILWTPETLRQSLEDVFGGSDLDYIVVNVEQDRDRKVIVPPTFTPYCEVAIWLPRIDQLLDMLKDEDGQWLGCSDLISYTGDEYAIGEWYDYEFDPVAGWWDTLEKALLAAIMRSRYGKVWDEKKGEWVGDE